jgi:ATP-binding cassette subfamily B protein
VLGVLCIFITIALTLLIPLVVGYAVDALLYEVIWRKLVRYALALLGISLLSGIFRFFQRRIMSGISRRVEFDIRQNFYAYLNQQQLSFYQSHRTGDLIARATNDLAAVREFIGVGISYSLQSVAYVLITLPLFLRISVPLTLLLYLTLPLISFTVRHFGHQIQIRFEKIQELFSQLSARALENFTGVRVVRVYAQEETELGAFSRLNREYSERSLSLVKISAAMSPLIKFQIGIGFLLIIWYGGTLAARGEITIGQFTEFNLQLRNLIWPIVALGNFVNSYQRGAASLKRIEEILAIKTHIADAGIVRELPPIVGHIEFRNLTFRYGEDAEPVLRNINLSIAAGQMVAFVGHTGSGKSTLMSVIPRVFEAVPQTVFIDGVPVSDYPISQLRASIGCVMQETFLFSDTIAANISFGMEEVSHDDIEWAADVAGLTEDVRGFPQAFETVIGERGIILSGGQKQRTAIARSVIRHPQILILDDALSAVDTYTEHKILARLRVFSRNRTTLIVSHRISTVREADLICVLEDGRIVERGTHHELLALGGVYSATYERQILEEELETI